MRMKVSLEWCGNQAGYYVSTPLTLAKANTFRHHQPSRMSTNVLLKNPSTTVLHPRTTQTPASPYDRHNPMAKPNPSS
uniref:Uncharacterized protein n=1 Tax=Steinernema glaseri TaxID=37863 RepID=A0A1I8A883_9BILA